MLPLYSPTPLRDFIWVANYADGSILTEFDYITKEKNDFYSIRKQDIIRFGLAGHGYHFYHDTVGGSFHLPQGKFDFRYVFESRSIDLTSGFDFCNDIITFKKANSTFDPTGVQNISNSQIVEYVFGYKKKISTDDFQAHVKIMFHIPFGSPMYISIRMVTEHDYNGKLQILEGGKVIEQIDSPLFKDTSSEINWEVH